MHKTKSRLLISLTLLCIQILCAESVENFRPDISGDWWRVASNPDLGEWTSDIQEPVDFGIWQAADGTWQLWSCIRKTKFPGRTRIFYRWEGSRIQDSDWMPKGVTFTGDGAIGETIGGMQAPYVIKVDGQYRMYYGDLRHICLALSENGKEFEKQLLAHQLSGLFGEGPTAMARDPMLTKIGPLWYCYYSAQPHGSSGIRVRTTKDLVNFSDPKLVMTGGQAGKDWWSFECPQVIYHGDWFYLFHTQHYETDRQQTSVYRSKDPTYFGIHDDSNFVCHLPVAAPEIIYVEGKMYLAALTNELDGIRITKLEWTPEN